MVLPTLWLWLSGKQDVALQQVIAHKHIVHAVGIGGYSLQKGGTLSGAVNATLTRGLAAAGVEVHALMGGGSMAVLRSLVQSPASERAFFAAAVDEAVRANLTGFNMDLEPYSQHVTNADGLMYAGFLDRFARALHARQRVLSVDYFTNLPFWNLAALNATALDRIISMDTCAQRTRRSRHLQRASPRSHTAALAHSRRALPSQVRAAERDLRGLLPSRDRVRLTGAPRHRHVCGRVSYRQAVRP